MVVRVLIIACFLKTAVSNPYLSSLSNANFPATSFATKVSPGGSTNQVPDLQPYNSHSYNVPQKTTQLFEEAKLSNPNKVSRPMAITPLSVTPEPYKSDKRQNNAVTSEISGSKTNTNIVNDSPFTIITSDMATPKYQHKPFSKTFNNFRENLLKTMDLGSKSKSPPESFLENVKNVDAETLKQMPNFVEPQTLPSTKPPLQPKDYLPGFVINSDMFRQQENQGVKEGLLMPVDAAQYKYHTVDQENISENGIQMSRVPYNYNKNVKPFKEISNFGKLSPNIQAKQDAYDNLPINKNLDRYISQLHLSELSALSFQPQENPLVFPAPPPLNQSLPVPYQEERNVSLALGVPYYNKLNSFNSIVLNDDFISGNQTLRENQLTMDPKSLLQMQTSKIPYYDKYNAFHSKLLTQPLIPGNQSMQEDSLVKINENRSSQENISNVLLKYNDKDKSGPQIQPLRVVPSNLQKNSSAIASQDLISQPVQILHNDEGNLTQIFRAPYYYNFYQPNSRLFSQQLIHDTLDPKYTSVERNGTKIPPASVILSALYENPIKVAGTEHQRKTEQLNSTEMKINDTLRNSTGTDKSVSQMQTILTSNPQLNRSQYIDAEIISQPAINSDRKEQKLNINLLHSTVNGDVPHEQSNSELSSDPKENLSDFIQTIDGTENMRTKNEITTQAHKDSNKILENEYQTSRMPYYNNFNLFNSRGFNQQVPPNNQQLKNNSQMSKKNQNGLAQDTNYGVPTSKILKKIEPQVPLLIPKPSNEKLVPPTHYLINSPDDARMNSEVILNSSLAHNGNLFGYEPQTSQVSYFNSFDPIISNALNQQILHSSQIAKDNQFPKADQRIMPPNNDNIITTIKNGNNNEPLTSRPQEYSAFPMRNLNSETENPRFDSGITKPYDNSDSKILPGNVGSVHRIESETFNPFLNALSRQSARNNKLTQDNPLINSSQDFPPKKDVDSILQINIPSRLLEIPQGSPTRNRFVSQENSMEEKEITTPFDDSEPKQHFSSSHDIRIIENEFQSKIIPYYNNFHSINSNFINQQSAHDNQMTNGDSSNKLTITNQNNFPGLDININLQNADNVDKNVPIEISITETPDESCTESNNNTSPNIIIDLYNKNEKPCGFLNAIQKCDKISTNIDDSILCFTKETDVTKQNNSTNSTETSSKSEDIIPSVDLDVFSSYLTDAILSAVQSFLIHSNGSSASNYDTDNDFNSIDKNSIQLEIPLLHTEKNISDPLIVIKESTTLSQNLEVENNSILGSNSTKQECPRILESDDMKNNTEHKVTPCLEPNLFSDEKILNETNQNVFNIISSNRYNKTLEPAEPTKDPHIGSNEIQQYPSKINEKQYSNTSNPDDKVLESANRIHELCISTDKTNQVPAKMYETPLNANKNEDTSSHVTSQILLPYYYYIDQINVTSSETDLTVPESNVVGTSEEKERIYVISPETDTCAMQTLIDSNPEVRRPCSPKPCLSKITVNILPVAEKNNNEILVFL